MRLMPCIMLVLKLCSLFLKIVAGLRYVSIRLRNIRLSIEVKLMHLMQITTVGVPVFTNFVHL